MFNPIPFSKSFDPLGYAYTTCTYTSMYANLLESSGYLDSKEEDDLCPGLDFSRLRDPEAMRLFLSVCDNLLFDGSNNYNSDDEGYHLTRECFHVGHEEHDEGNQLGMPREANTPALAPHARDPREQGVAQTPMGSHITHLKQLCELHAKLGEVGTIA